MRLPFLRPKPPAPPARGRAAAAVDDAAAVQAARTRARRRLVGALVLLGAGIVGFPVLFETRPRPLPMDTPIEIARRGDAAVPLPQGTIHPVTQQPEPLPPPVLPPAGAGNGTAPTTEAAASATDASAGATAAPPAAAAAASTAPAAAASAAAPASAPGRYVVQVGAFSDATALRDARSKVERLGLKTYTQVVDTAAGQRTRVRVGPFATRDDADAAAARVKRSGLPANILVL